MKLSPQSKKAQYLQAFRNEIGVGLSREMVHTIWGDTISDEVLQSLDGSQGENEIVKEKLEKAKEITKTLEKKPFVKYLGVSGSVGVGSATKGDDIDIFLVVRDHTSWLVRLLLKISLRGNTVWYGQKKQKDKLCLNYITEERALSFENQDIFILNEIYSLKHLINPDYFDTILSYNRWLKDDYYALIPEVEGQKGFFHRLLSIPLSIFNFLLFIPQIIYMAAAGHNPDYGRLFKGFRKGWVRFYPKEFREEKIEQFRMKLGS